MTTIQGKTLRHPPGPYWYWTTLGPNNVTLTDAQVALPPGSYYLYYEFYGTPGSQLAFEIHGPAGVLATVAGTIPSNSHDGWGKSSFVVP